MVVTRHVTRVKRLSLHAAPVVGVIGRGRGKLRVGAPVARAVVARSFAELRWSRRINLGEAARPVVSPVFLGVSPSIGIVVG